MTETMQNLARSSDANDYQLKQVESTVLRELKRCRIPVIEQPAQGEVPYKHVGKLGDFTFERAWYYWVVHGPVPLEVAKELYEDVVGVTDIRVNGHCGCPAPGEPGGRPHYFDEDGNTLALDPDGEEEKRWKDFVAKGLIDARDDILFASDPAAVAARAVVETYHIDSELGLRIFVDTLAKHGVVELGASS